MFRLCLSRFVPAIFLIVILVGTFDKVAVAAPADVVASGWRVDFFDGKLRGRIKAKGIPAFRLRGFGSADILFGPMETLAADEFLLLVDDGEDTLQFEGTYVLNRRGKPVLFVNPAKSEDEFEDLLEEIFGLVDLGFD